MALFLAIATFALSLLGTFLVRSGAISSVHAFTTDPERGVFILQFLAISIGGALFLYGIRVPMLQLPRPLKLSLNSTDAVILANNILLLVATGTVLLGTLYPLIYDVLFAAKISVGYPYFNAVFLPITLVLLSILLLGITPGYKYLLYIAIASVVLVILFFSLYFDLLKLNACIGLSFAVAIIITSCMAYVKNPNRTKLPMTIAHIGLAVSIIGISITPAYEIERDVRMHIGDVAKLKHYHIKFNSVESIDGPNYLSYKGSFDVMRNNKIITSLYPEKRLYLAQELPMTETAIYPGVLQDIYIALGQQLDVNTWSVRLYYKPFIRFIWLGALLMSFSAFYSLIQKRRLKC